ncbi:MAG TPA: globin [Nitriliruptorales bacterium]
MPEQEPQQVPPHVDVYAMAGGERAFFDLIEAFYAKVEDDELLRPLYPDDLEPGKRHLALFFAQYWGGPPRYNDERGHPRLRRRHAPFQITHAAALRWAELMAASVLEQSWPQEAEQAMLHYIARFTPSMINAPG